MRQKNNRFAFTMMELIFVIVVMGILGTYGVEFLARAYDSFIFSKINYDLQSKSGAAVEFISKRLEHRIKRSVRYHNLVTNNIQYLSSATYDDDASVLEWVAADIDGFRGISSPYWSGVIDLNSSTGAALVSPGSNFSSANTVINTLSNGATDINDSAIYFINSRFTESNPWGYDGTIDDQNHTIHPIKASSNTTLIPFDSTKTFSGKKIHEYYKLSWTANAIAMENPHGENNEMHDLYFYYNYQPWQNEQYNSAGTKKVLLAKDISSFRFRAAGSLIKIQICAKSDLLKNDDVGYALCKEKTVF